MPIDRDWISSQVGSVGSWNRRMFFQGLPQQCQVCQLPISFTEKDDPGKLSFRRSEFRGETFHTCSDGCKWIFDREPEKYVQAWLPVHRSSRATAAARQFRMSLPGTGSRQETTASTPAPRTSSSGGP